MAYYNVPKIVAVGPLPPPLGGTSVSFQIFCDEAGHYPNKVSLEIVNSAPKQIKEPTRLFTSANYATARDVLLQFGAKIKQADQALIFGADLFLHSMAPLCLCIAKIAGKPCFLRAFGGSLDQYYHSLNPLSRWLFRLAIGHADGLIVQTELLHQYFRQQIGDKVYWVPGYRYMPASHNGYMHYPQPSNRNLRLVFLGHIREEKGIFVLLESLRSLGVNGRASIHCDIYGPVFPSVVGRFEYEIAQMKNATYKGILKPEQVIGTLGQYDALVLPSYFQGEGHPGVVIEAMMAGIPTITTDFRSIPELVYDQVNGLLVPPHSPPHLADAIRLIDDDRQLLWKMGKTNWEMRTKYTAAQLVPQILQPLGVELS